MDDAITIAKKGLDVFDHGDWTAFRDDLAPDCVYRQFATGDEVQGIEENVKVAKAWHDAFPDINAEVINAFESGDQATLQIIWTGTHTGDLVGPEGTIPATGRKASVPACQIVRVQGDKIVSTDHYFDLLTLFAQLQVEPIAAEVP
jgi:steroid delta-isomerase-like uncharacterized protein